MKNYPGGKELMFLHEDISYVVVTHQSSEIKKNYVSISTNIFMKKWD